MSTGMFKPGDRVRLIADFDVIDAGSVGTVGEYSGRAFDMDVWWDNYNEVNPVLHYENEVEID